MSTNKKADKINDFNYTINFFKSIGVEEKYKNHKYITFLSLSLLYKIYTYNKFFFKFFKIPLNGFCHFNYYFCIILII